MRNKCGNLVLHYMIVGITLEWLAFFKRKPPFVTEEEYFFFFPPFFKHVHMGARAQEKNQDLSSQMSIRKINV